MELVSSCFYLNEKKMIDFEKLQKLLVKSHGFCLVITILRYSESYNCFQILK